jgi:hypothetical protein
VIRCFFSTKYLNLKHSKTNCKLLSKWIGPFEIVQVVEPIAYKLKINPGWRVHHVFHVSLLELYKEDGRVHPHHLPLKWKALSSMRWSRFLSMNSTRNLKAYYKVAWKVYGIEHNSWEPESNVVNAPEVVADYWKRQAEKQAGLGALLFA